ncbi:MAG: hypothetical protein ACE5OZ_01105 [Candidatus Heimdallarchaeota archaeon]
MGTARKKRLPRDFHSIRRNLSEGISFLNTEEGKTRFKEGLTKATKLTLLSTKGINAQLLPAAVSISSRGSKFVNEVAERGFTVAIKSHIKPTGDFERDLTSYVSKVLVPTDVHPSIRQRLIRTNIAVLKKRLPSERALKRRKGGR